MICRELCLVALLGAGTVLARAADGTAAAAPAAGQFDSLVKNSPFGQAPVTGMAAGSDGSTIEFRGVFADKGEYFFSLYETATRTSQWVGLKETGNPFLIESYDPEKGSIQLKYRNQPLALTLKRAQVVVQAIPAAPMPVANPNVAVVNGAPAIAATPASQDEAARMAQVAEEIRRRRALRNPPGTTPQLLPGANAPALINPPRPVTPAPRQ